MILYWFSYHQTLVEDAGAAVFLVVGIKDLFPGPFDRNANPIIVANCWCEIACDHQTVFLPPRFPDVEHHTIFTITIVEPFETFLFETKLIQSRLGFIQMIQVLNDLINSLVET